MAHHKIKVNMMHFAPDNPYIAEDSKTLHADEDLINWLFDESGISVYKISKKTGISKQTLYNLVNGYSKIENITFGNAATLTEYAETIKNNEEI